MRGMEAPTRPRTAPPPKASALRLELKRLARGSLIYGVGSVLQRFLTLLLLPLFTRVLTPEDYGVIAIIGLLSVALTGVFTLGTGNSLGVLYFQEEETARRPAIVWSNALLVVVTCTGLVGLLSAGAEGISSVVFQTSEYADYLVIAFITLGLTTVADPFLAYLRMEERARTYVVLTLCHTLVTTGFSILLVLILRWGIKGLLVANLAGQLATLCLVMAIVPRDLPFGIDRQVFLPLVRVGFPSIFGLFAFLLIDYADRQMLQRMVGLEALGVYSIGYSFGMMISVLVGAFATAWPPFFMSFSQRLPEARKLFGRIFEYYLLAFGLISAAFFVVARPAVIVLVAPEFRSAYVVVGVVAAAYMLKGCYLILLPGIYFARKLAYQSGIEWVAAIINVLLNFFLIPRYGILGAAGATLAAYAALPVLSWLVSRRYLAVTYDRRAIALSVLGLSAATSASLAASVRLSIWPSIFATTAIYALLCVFVWLVVLSAPERESAAGWIRARIEPFLSR